MFQLLLEHLFLVTCSFNDILWITCSATATFHHIKNYWLIMWKYIRLKVSTRKLPEKKHFIRISLFWSTNKVQQFFFQKIKRGKPKIVTKFLLFWKIILLNISIWLFSIANGTACIICLTAIVKMCSISCSSLIHKYA